MTNKELANLIFPNITKTVVDYETMYPKRNLDKSAIVTRFAPSPTGFVHMGSLLTAFISRKMARDTNGVFFLRIEDTDQEREVENGVAGIVSDLKDFGVTIDEGMLNNTDYIGNYGTYIQSKRKEIYQAFAKHLLSEGLAYPCFCSSEEISEIRANQEASKERIGYYGKYAHCRFLTNEEMAEKIQNGDNYIIRLKSPGNFDNKVVFNDLVKGTVEFPENDMDIVLLKSDGLPTYHFAHLVDDHLMRTTHVIRGDEWLSSLPLHLQLFKVFGFKEPKYAHLSPVMKQDGESKRKLSKRKDPEASMGFYREKGIPVPAVHLYLLTIANTNFELWYEANKDKSIDEFKLDFKKISSSGSLFDVDKLFNISKNYISTLRAEEVYNNTFAWASIYDAELKDLLTKYKDYSVKIFNIEREQPKPRKDYGSYSEIKSQIWYMYDELFNLNNDYEFQKINEKNDIKLILDTYFNKYLNLTDKESWFNNIKLLCDELGYASNMKEYKENPDKFKGNVADVSTAIRVALTSKAMTPDLYEIMVLLGKDRILSRFNKVTK